MISNFQFCVLEPIEHVLASLGQEVSFVQHPEREPNESHSMDLHSWGAHMPAAKIYAFTLAADFQPMESRGARQPYHARIFQALCPSSAVTAAEPEVAGHGTGV